LKGGTRVAARERMIRSTLVIGALLLSACSPALQVEPERRASDLYFKTVGNPKNRAVVFLHGGPGASSYAFEAAVADALALRGNFVVSYDQRGSGRSPDGTAEDYRYAKSTQDLDDLIHSLDLKNPVLLGYSFGGTVAMKYLELHPGVARGVVLLATPIDFPNVYSNVHERCVDQYRGVLALGKAREVEALHARMFPRGLVAPYGYTGADIAQTMEHATTCGLMRPRVATAEALKLWASLLGADRELVSSIEGAVGDGYQRNDHVGYLDFVAQVGAKGAPIRGIYGDEDGLFSAHQLTQISTLLGPDRFSSIHGASHGVFIDRRTEFLDALSKHLDAFASN
jgi:proline iminopeptidase